MMLPHLDIEGRLEANPKIIKGNITTLLGYTPSQIQQCLDDMHSVGLITLYTVNGAQLLEYTKFAEFQNLQENREAKSEIPPIPTELQSTHTELQSTVRELSIKISKEKLSKEKYKDFVFLTKEEHEKLISSLGVKETENKIIALNNYLGSTGKRYKNHYFTILNWSRRDGVTNIAKATCSKKCFICKEPATIEIASGRGYRSICNGCQTALVAAPDFIARGGKVIPKNFLELSQIEAMVLKQKARTNDYAREAVIRELAQE